MNPVIARVITTDEAARDTVAHAEQEAAQLVAEAEDRARKMLEALEVQILEAEQHDIQPLLAEGQEQAKLIMAQAEHYVERLQQDLALKKNKIVDDCIELLLKQGSQ